METGNRKPLSFPPGNIAFVNREGFQFKPVKTLTFTEPTPITLDEAAKRLQALLEESIQRRTHDVKEVAVAFSGGLDSSLVAYLASKLGVKVNLLHVSMENQAETEEAIEASNRLNLPLQMHLFKDSDVEKTLPKVVELIEEADPIKASVGLPFYWAAEKAAEAGFQVMLAGQGADELFGGYQRYVNEYCKEGSETVRKTMFNDVVIFFRPADTELRAYAEIAAVTTGEKVDEWVKKLAALKKGECYSLGPSLNESSGKLEVKAFRVKIRTSLQSWAVDYE